MTHSPFHEVPMFQARCTSCGYIETDYDEFGGFSEPEGAVEFVTEVRAWHRSDDWPPSELLCVACQKCAVCGADTCYPHDDGQHVVCEHHEDHDFDKPPRPQLRSVPS